MGWRRNGYWNIITIIITFYVRLSFYTAMLAGTKIKWHRVSLYSIILTIVLDLSIAIIWIVFFLSGLPFLVILFQVSWLQEHFNEVCTSHRHISNFPWFLLKYMYFSSFLDLSISHNAVFIWSIFWSYPVQLKCTILLSIKDVRPKAEV